jgi:hypothetical protein
VPPIEIRPLVDVPRGSVWRLVDDERVTHKPLIMTIAEPCNLARSRGRMWPFTPGQCSGSVHFERACF